MHRNEIELKSRGPARHHESTGQSQEAFPLGDLALTYTESVIEMFLGHAQCFTAGNERVDQLTVIGALDIGWLT